MQPIQFRRPDQREVELQPWTDHDLDAMAEISETDKQRTAAYWRRYMPRRLRGLLDALSTVGR